MYSREKKSVIAAFIILTMSTSVAGTTYLIVKKGENLLRMLYKNKLLPIHGEHGSWAKVLRLNPELSSSKGNKIFPRMKIIIVEPIVEPVKITETVKELEVAKEVERVKEELPPVITPIVVPVKLANQEIQDEFKQFFYWNVAPEISWKYLTSTDENIYRSSQINALSNLNYGISFSYGKQIKKNLDIYSKIFLESVSFIGDSAINLLQKKFVTHEFSLGVNYQKNGNLSLP
jgi:hypothetical protein